jgi:hypothetical protein
LPSWLDGVVADDVLEIAIELATTDGLDGTPWREPRRV